MRDQLKNAVTSVGHLCAEHYGLGMNWQESAPRQNDKGPNLRPSLCGGLIAETSWAMPKWIIDHNAHERHDSRASAMSRYASRFNKRDEVEAEGVKALAQLGVEWIEGGPLDGWVWLGQWMPIEWKSGKGGRLTAGQKDFISRCNMLERPYRIWRTPLEAIESVQEWRGKQRVAA